MSDTPKPGAFDGEEYRPVLDPDIAAATDKDTPKAATTSSSASTSKPEIPTSIAPTTGAQSSPTKPDASAMDVRYVKKTPSAIGRWFLRNLFSLLVTLIIAIFVISNLATPMVFTVAGQLTLKFIGLDVTGPTWVFMVILFGAGFLAGAFFLRRWKVREKKASAT